VKNNFPEITSFRDCTTYFRLQNVMSADFLKSSLLVKEINRVSWHVKHWISGNIETLGKLMFETHEGLSIYYEVSCAELDMIVNT
jgi:galactokinase